MFTVTFAVMVSLSFLFPKITSACHADVHSWLILWVTSSQTSVVQQPCKYNLPSCVPCPDLIIPF